MEPREYYKCLKFSSYTYMPYKCTLYRKQLLEEVHFSYETPLVNNYGGVRAASIGRSEVRFAKKGGYPISHAKRMIAWSKTAWGKIV